MNPGCALRRCKLIPADIYFLADNTGSMGAVINAVKSGAGQILTSLTSSINDLYTGGGGYRDRRSGFMFQNSASVAGGTGGAQSAINAWSASSGGDEPEGQLYALYQARQHTVCMCLLLIARHALHLPLVGASNEHQAGCCCQAAPAGRFLLPCVSAP